MGLLKITLDDKRALSVSERRYVPLDRSVPDNGEIVRLVEKHKKTQEQKQQEKQEKTQKELMEGLKLSPKEFMERYRKEQPEKKKRGITVKNNGRTLLAAACWLMLILLAGCAALSSLTAKGVPRGKGQKLQRPRSTENGTAPMPFLTILREKYDTGDTLAGPERLNKGIQIEEIAVLPSGDQETVKVRKDISYMGFNFKAVSHTQHWVKERGSGL